MQPRVGVGSVGSVGGVGRGKSINSLSPHTQKPYKQWICRYLSAIRCKTHKIMVVAHYPPPNTCRLRGKGEGERGKKKPLTLTL